MTDYTRVRKILTNIIEHSSDCFLIFPFGELGLLTKQILNGCFGIMEKGIFDNNLCKYNPKIKSLENMEKELSGLSKKRAYGLIYRQKRGTPSNAEKVLPIGEEHQPCGICRASRGPGILWLFVGKLRLYRKNRRFLQVC